MNKNKLASIYEEVFKRNYEDFIDPDTLYYAKENNRRVFAGFMADNYKGENYFDDLGDEIGNLAADTICQFFYMGYAIWVAKQMIEDNFAPVKNPDNEKIADDFLDLQIDFDEKRFKLPGDAEFLIAAEAEKFCDVFRKTNKLNQDATFYGKLERIFTKQAVDGYLMAEATAKYRTMLKV